MNYCRKIEAFPPLQYIVKSIRSQYINLPGGTYTILISDAEVSMTNTRIGQKLRKKLPFLLLFGSVLLTLFLWGTLSGKAPSSFEVLSHEMVCQELSGNTLNLHYTMADPSLYGIQEEEVLLPSYPLPGEDDRDHTLLSWKEAFVSLDDSDLTSKERFLRELLLQQLTLEEELSSYPYLLNPLAPHSGQQATLLTLLSEYNFYEKEDIEEYLTLLELIPGYLESLSSYMTKKVEMGFSPGSEILMETAQNCRNYFPTKPLMCQTHFLQESFESRLSRYACISEKEARDYRQRHNHLLKEKLRPAYLQLAKDLEQLSSFSSPVCGLGAFPKGTRYYELLLQAQTGINDSLKERKDKLYSAFSQTRQKCISLGELLPKNMDASMQDSMADAFPLKTPEEMLDYLIDRMKQDFPFPEHYEEAAIHTRLCQVSESMQSSSAPAFYLLPPIDSYKENVIYLNPQNKEYPWTLFTTLAHEGYPGHLYQTTYSYSLWEDKYEAPLRSLFSYPGFQEGYALYVEFLSYEYAAELYEAMGQPDMATYVRYEKESKNLELCLLSLIELMIHGDGDDLSSVNNLLCAFQITDEDFLHTLYNYIASQPCCYTKYYLGYLEILSLKEKAKETWKNSYSDLAFHEFLLENGPADFNSLELILYKVP